MEASAGCMCNSMSDDSLSLFSKNTLKRGCLRFIFDIEQFELSHEGVKYVIQTSQILPGVALLVCNLL